MMSRSMASLDGCISASSALMWEDAVHTGIGRMPAELRHQEVIHLLPVGAQAFSGRIDYGDLAGTGLCRMTASPHRFQRALREGASLAASPLILVIQVKNSSYFEQRERSGMLSPGDWCVLDTYRPFGWNSASGCEQIIMTIQRPADSGLGDLIARGAAQRCDGKTGAARILQAMVSEVMGQIHHLAPYSAGSLASALTATAWNALQEQLEAPAPILLRDTQCSRLKAWIETRLAEPDLSVDTIAQGCRMSARSVHRAFSSDPTGSVSSYLWQRRVVQCAAALKNPQEMHRSITDIALSWGFSSSSHFSRVFRSTLGVSPRSYRAGGQHADWLAAWSGVVPEPDRPKAS
ncbi:helix-turn-helix domain-containing protein [Polaromonas naphthalenivorans]|uniref:Transcriptional regulator, AraC family n=1 Tax=Polaromonas naphthalenivorans (strain CJ2) TaxID=365044 RepID=A1VJU8_POLNA|nr:helix-turn-helix domain-containing protein [Polaromonas naphthalenivorans]ABM35926.1 transcriptional regulator, AraC family [Polaromonas naphthalenivorans CJ2]